MTSKPFNVLFVCTGNTARSILSEAILNARGAGRFRAYSAGSHPKGRINAAVADWLRRQGVPTEGLRSKSWEEFAAPGAPRMDAVITVCDSAASEACPAWPGAPVSAHWGVPDPGAADDDPAELQRLVEQAYDILSRRIARLVALPVERMDAAALQAELRAIGRET